MPTVMDLALMAKAVYRASPDVPNWTRLNFRAASGILDGFQAAAFSGQGGIVIAFRGSAQGEDWLVNAAYGAGMNTVRFSQAENFAVKEAKNFTAMFGNAPVYITGHSLGGAIAQIVANRRGYKFVTFNAPGVAVLASRNIDQMAASVVTGMFGVRVAGAIASTFVHPQQAYRDIKAAFKKAHGLNVCLKTDGVSQIGVHYGKVKRISSDTNNPLTAHKMDTVLAALQNDPVARIDVNTL